MIPIGRKIKGFRKGQKLTQKDFAEPMGFSHQYLSEIEKGIVEPSPRFFLLLKSIYGLDFTEQKEEPTKDLTSSMLHGIVAETQTEYYESAREREYCEKLQHIFRTKDDGVIEAITQNIDTFMRVPGDVKKTRDKAA